MNYRKTLIAGAVASMVAIAGSAFAGDKMHSSGSAFSTLDTNGDGKISQAEAAADSSLTFSTADANGDGYISKSEFKKAMKSTPGSSSPIDGARTPPQPQSQSTDPAQDPSSTSSQSEPLPQQDQSAPPPADTETPPRQ